MLGKIKGEYEIKCPRCKVMNNSIPEPTFGLARAVDLHFDETEVKKELLEMALKEYEHLKERVEDEKDYRRV